MEYIFVDQDGYQEMLKDIELIKKRMKENNRLKGEAASGDAGNSTHDNFDYEQAKQQEIMLMAQLENAYEKLKRVKIIEKTGDDTIIDIGDYVVLEIDLGGEKEIYKIKLIGGNSPQNIFGDIQCVTVNSPIGSAIYKKKEGDVTSYNVNGNVIPLTIIKKLSKEEVLEISQNSRKK